MVTNEKINPKYLGFILLLFTAVTVFYFTSSWLNLPAGFRYIYPVDDVYIHLALAKNFAELGQWTTNPGSFESASSSLLYTFLLAGCIKVFGNWEYYPLVLNVIFGYATVYAVYRYFKDFYGRREFWVALLMLLPLTYLHVMTLMGMEHTLHMFLMVGCIYFLQKNLNTEFKRSDFIFLPIFIFFNGMVRFESLFFTATLSLALCFRGNFLKALLILTAGTLPIVIFGLISLKMGGFFFPNSVMVKGAYTAHQNIFGQFFLMLKEGILLNTSFYKCLSIPFLVLVADNFQKYKGKKLADFLKNETLVINLVLMAILHALFAKLRYRYENYLMISMLLVSIPALVSLLTSAKTKKSLLLQTVAYFSMAAFAGICFWRIYTQHKPNMYSSEGIRQQQIEMSRFMGKYYRGQNIAANDIGAISYYSGVQITDIVGLATLDITKMIVRQKGEPENIADAKLHDEIERYIQQKGCKVALIYPSWYPQSVPQSWIPVGSWTNSVKYGPAIPSVVFYALDSQEVLPLRDHLQKFDLDPRVKLQLYGKQ